MNDYVNEVIKVNNVGSKTALSGRASDDSNWGAEQFSLCPRNHLLLCLPLILFTFLLKADEGCCQQSFYLKHLNSVGPALASGSVGHSSSHTPKGCGFHPQSGFDPRSGHVWEVTDECSLSLKKIGKRVLGWGFKKNSLYDLSRTL